MKKLIFYLITLLLQRSTLVNEPKQAGEHTIDLDANKYGLSSGVYLYQLTAGSFTSVKKFILMK